MQLYYMENQTLSEYLQFEQERRTRQAFECLRYKKMLRNECSCVPFRFRFIIRTVDDTSILYCAKAHNSDGLSRPNEIIVRIIAIQTM